MMDSNFADAVKDFKVAIRIAKFSPVLCDKLDRVHAGLGRAYLNLEHFKLCLQEFQLISILLNLHH